MLLEYHNKYKKQKFLLVTISQCNSPKSKISFSVNSLSLISQYNRTLCQTSTTEARWLTGRYMAFTWYVPWICPSAMRTLERKTESSRHSTAAPNASMTTWACFFSNSSSRCTLERVPVPLGLPSAVFAWTGSGAFSTVESSFWSRFTNKLFSSLSVWNNLSRKMMEHMNFFFRMDIVQLCL